ncbi:MAG: phage tail protein, partial [Prevotella sp.]|nr:phage tail protein [Prevotella sp.]
MNTDDFIKAARVKGDIGKLRVTNSDILLSGKSDPTVSDVNLSDVLLKDAHIDVVLADSVPEDTTKSDTPWRILAEKISVKNSDVVIKNSGNPDVIEAKIGNAMVRNGVFDLKNGRYEVGEVDIQKSGGRYNDISVSDVALKADSIRFSAENGTNLSANLRSLSLKEKGGTDVKNVSGQVAIADNRLKLKNATIQTSESYLSADFEMSLDAFSDQNPGTMKGIVHASLGKQELMRVMKDMPAGFRQKWPNQPLKIDGEVRGNMKNLSFKDLSLSLPTAFQAKASGTLQNLDNLEHLKADVDFKARGENLDFVKELMPKGVKNDVQIPRGLALSGNAKVNGQQYDANFKASTAGNGTLAGNVKLDADRMIYDAKLKADRFPLQQFAPKYGLSPLTATIDLKGQGADLMSPRTQLSASADVQQLNYSGYNLSGLKADAKVINGRAKATLNSQNDLLQGVATVDALMSKNRLRGTVLMDLSKADLKRLGVSDSVMSVSGCAHVDIDSNLGDHHKIQGNIGDLALQMGSETYRPDDMWIDVQTGPTKTLAKVDCDDFHLNLDAKGSYKQLLDAGNRLMAEVQKQYGERTINESRLRSMLPDARLSLSSGRDNFIVDMLSRSGYRFDNLNCNVVSSSVSGLNGQLHIESLQADGILLDTINLALQSDSVRTIYQAQIRNNKKNPQYTFNALVDGILQDRGTTFGTRLYDENGDLGVRLGLQATMEDNGFMLRTYGKEPVLGFRKFKVNDDNYVFLSQDGRVSADVVLRADDGTGVQIYTNDANDDAKQDVTVSVHNFDLERILSVIPYTPDVKGMMSGDFHFVQTDNQVTVSTDLGVKDLIYEKSPIGNLGAEFVYMPKTDGSHYIDGILQDRGTT